jgi:site-specific DNA-methyltransferase (adenine-specific)
MKISNGEFWQGDCLELMKQIPDGSVDMILCDLPYGTTACKWDEIIPFEPLWEQYWRVAKPNAAIVLTASQPFTSALVMSQPKAFKYCWTWNKVKPNGHLVAKIRPMQQTEDIAVFGKGKVNYFPIMTARENPKRSKEFRRTEVMGGKQTGSDKILTDKNPTTLLEFSNASQSGKIHPTQKPVALFEYLIKTYTNEGMTVLDNCAGSGTTAISAENLKRNWICIEQDEAYYNAATNRVKEHIAA